MENLSGKVDTVDNLPAGEWNQPATEQNNIIIQTAQTPVSTDLNQLGKGMAEYVANGNFYIDSGVVNSFILSTVGLKQSPPRYVDGMEISFIAANTNTGTTTANVSGLGALSIVNANTGGEIQAGARIDLVYRSATNDCLFLQSSGTVEAVYPVTTGTAAAYTIVLGAQSYVTNGSYRMRAHIANTGPATIDFDGLGLKTILTSEGQPLAAGQFVNVVELFYDGTNLILAYSGQVSSGDVSGLGALATKNTAASADIDADAVTTIKVRDGDITQPKLDLLVQNQLVPGGSGHTQQASSILNLDNSHTHIASNITDLGTLAVKNVIGHSDVNWAASRGISQGAILSGELIQTSFPGGSLVFIDVPNAAINLYIPATVVLVRAYFDLAVSLPRTSYGRIVINGVSGSNAIAISAAYTTVFSEVSTTALNGVYQVKIQWAGDGNTPTVSIKSMSFILWS